MKINYTYFQDEDGTFVIRNIEDGINIAIAKENSIAERIAFALNKVKEMKDNGIMVVLATDG